MNNYRALSPALAKMAKDELNENSSRISEEIEILRYWILQQPHLKARTEAQYLLSFLRGCKHSLERTKEKIDKFYSLRSSLPEVYNNRFVDDQKMLAIAQLGVALRLPHTNGEDGPRIIIIRSGAYDATKYRFADMIRFGSMLGDIGFMEDDNASVAGQIEILDLADVTAHHFFDFEPLFIKKLITFSEKASPIRQKGIHFINTPPGFETIFNTIRSFMSEEKKKRVFVHGNLQSLYEFVPQNLLPVEYGGTNGCVQDIIDHWAKKLLEYRAFFVEESKLGSDERLRIGEPFNPESVFGINGTFRTLDID